MNLQRFFHLPPRPGAKPARPVHAELPDLPGRWIEGIAAGHAILFEAAAEGFRLATDTRYEEGMMLQLAVPRIRPDGSDLSLNAEVAWRRRSDHPLFGRYTCGLVFRPTDQPGIAAVTARARTAGYPPRVKGNGTGNADLTLSSAAGTTGGNESAA